MKILPAALLPLLLPLAVAAQSPLTTQRLTDTIPYIMEHHARRLAQFEGEPVVTGRVIFLGNSITEGGDWPRLLGDSTVMNRGISGDITFGVLKRLEDVTRRKLSKLFILIGINDIGKDIPDLVIADNHRKIIQAVQAKSPGTKIYVQSLLPVNPDVPGFPQHYDKQEHVIHVNRLLRLVADSTGTRFVDLFPAFVDSRNRLDARYTGDGLHLNEAGYRAWADHLRKLGHL
jgi:lysophospholipase L1-like esterase